MYTHCYNRVPDTRVLSGGRPINSRCNVNAPPYYSNLGKRISKSPKVYFIDIGLACSLAGVRDEGHLFNGPMPETVTISSAADARKAYADQADDPPQGG